MFTRRQMVGGAAALAGIGAAGIERVDEGIADLPVLRAPRLRPGDLVALVAPASVTYERQILQMAVESLQALGLQVQVGTHALSRFGYFAGTDEERAADVNAAFADSAVRAVVALRGGWGSARTLAHIDFDVLRANPKVLVGYSDITSLLNAAYAKTGLVVFHGPMGVSPWGEFSTKAFKRMLFDAEQPLMQNPLIRRGTLAVREHRTGTISSGRATGRLIGGNLTLFSGLIGTPFFPDPQGAILFLEEVGEYIYRCDRMLTQLALAGVFEQVSGVVFGSFTDCRVAPDGYGSFALEDIFEQHLGKRGKPTFFGAMFGHQAQKRTIPIGARATIDADAGTIHLLEPAVI